MKFSTAARAIVCVLVLHAIFILTHAYFLFPWLDILMHALGGFVMALLGLAIHHRVMSASHLKEIPVWYQWLFVIGFAMLIGVVWEFYEYVMDQTLAVWFSWPRAQVSLTDTMMDFLNDFIGACVAFGLFFRKA